MIRARSRRRSTSAVPFLIAAIAGCNPVPTPPIGVDNGTTLPITIIANGAVVDNVPPKTSRTIPTTAIGPMPWTVEAISPTGGVLLTLSVHAGSVRSTTEPDGSTSQHGAAARIDLSCGRLDLYVGPPLAGPMPGPGVPGDCEG